MKTCPTCGKQYEDANTLCPLDGAVLKKPPQDDGLIGQVIAGKYRVDEKIDEGGMGCVYRGTHILMEKTVAIKVLHPALAADDKIVARFTREARAASRISHPHAIVVTDFGESETGVVYLVMEYLRGHTLKDVVRGEGPLPLARAVEISRQVSGALDAAHAEGVVHRDLKSDNIMLEEASGGGDWAKVLDFGIAKVQEPLGKTDPGLTAPNLIIGTPQYMSPEQCSQASDIDSRSDIYSLGVIVFEMLAGHVPFTGDSPTAIMMKHLQEPPPSILDERRDLPAGVGRVVARALAKRPEDRFQRAGELADALAQAAEEAPAVTVGVGGKAADTNRIVIPTSENEPPHTTAGELDEATVVSGEISPVSRESLPPPVAPVPESTFNPWRIAVPAIAALVIIFAVVYAFQRGGGTPAEEQTSPLTTDPNSQPAQSITPPTGQAENDLAPAQTPTSNPPGAGGGIPATVTEPNENAAATPTPTPERDDENRNQNDSAEEDTDEESEPEATPTPAGRTRRPLNINADVEVEPPPPPTPRQRPQQKPTPKLLDTVKPDPDRPKPPDGPTVSDQ